MNVFTRAWKNFPLSPGERAFLKFLWGALWTALIAGLSAVVQYLATGQVIQWQVILSVGIGAAWVALGETLRKYFTAHGDPPLPPPPSPPPALPPSAL